MHPMRGNDREKVTIEEPLLGDGFSNKRVLCAGSSPDEAIGIFPIYLILSAALGPLVC
jgi:hypothetical protein